MYQNLAISPLFFQIHDQVFAETELLNNLYTETILCDKEKNLLQEYIELFDIQDSLPQYKQVFINKLTISGRIKFCDNVVKKRKPSEFVRYETEKVLALNDEWKIILTYKIEDAMKMKFKLERNIEIVGARDYLEPVHDSKIKAPGVIKMKEGDDFDIRQWLLKYIKKSKEILVRDGYVCVNDSSYEDLKWLIKNIDRASSIKVITLSDKARKSDHSEKDEIKVEDRLKELKSEFSGFTYELVDSKRELRDRAIETDNWYINLGHALGSTKNKKVKAAFEITVLHKKTEYHHY